MTLSMSTASRSHQSAFERGLGVIQKGLGVYNTIKGVYEVGKVVAPFVSALF